MKNTAISRLACLLILLSPAATYAQFDDDEIRPGLVGTYDVAGRKFQRIDPRIVLSSRAALTDPRLVDGPLRIVWDGRLMSQANGDYQLAVFAQGKVRVKLADRVVIAGESAEPKWFESQPIPLSFDWHALQVEFTAHDVDRTGDANGPDNVQGNGAVNRIDAAEFQVSLFWSGPGFQREPVSQRQLFHDPAKSPEPDDLEFGEQLVRSLRCRACHVLDTGPRPSLAPDLSKLGGNVHPGWLIQRLAEHGELAPTVRRMPSFGLTDYQVGSLAAWLTRSNDAAPVEMRGDARKGETLFLQRGCLACHTWNELGTGGLFSGGDLTAIAAKRPPSFFARWLKDPASLNANHRMPVFTLTAEERNHLAAFLASCSKPAENVSAVGETLDGALLFKNFRCATCHDAKARRATVRIKPPTTWTSTCLDAPDPKKQRPGYELPPLAARAVRAYLNFVTDAGSRLAKQTGAHLLEELNCLNCHRRDTFHGLATRLTEVVKKRPGLASRLPAMSPPPLNSVGDKLTAAALKDAILTKSGVRRPWLDVRMPRFRISDDELNALADYLVFSDRIPGPGQPASGQANAVRAVPKRTPAIAAAGPRLVTPDGFGCTSCHDVGKVKPPKAPLNARAPDLLQLGKRIRYEWFDRWVRNPARIVPRMEMPSIKLAVRGVLHENLEDQLAAVWHVLNEPGFQPPEPNPVRTVRRSGVPDEHRRLAPAAVLTDVLKTGDRTYLKPLLIGLGNRHNVLLDLDRGGLSEWWVGDVGRQRTKGKTWFWEGGGRNLLPDVAKAAELRLATERGVLPPERRGQFTTRLEQLSRTEAGVDFSYYLDFSRRALVSESIRIVDPPDGPDSGFERRIRLSQLGEKAIPVELHPWLGRTKVDVSSDGRVLRMRSDGITRISIIEPAAVRWNSDGSIVGFSTADELVLRYETQLPVDRFPVVPPVPPRPEPVELNVVPGFAAVQLPVQAEIMPTGIAFDGNGNAFVSSLKGRVWRYRDTDGDGLHDQARPLFPELAAPYGLDVHSGSSGDADRVIVVDKTGLIELKLGGDFEVESIRTLAAGWGHTTDYHDWAVGLPKDASGNYYVALPCQQDDRSPAAARLRGKLLRLTPNETASSYSIETVTAGHRFPMGIAINGRGELFVTDNQGNYNPFNELNHIVPGSHFGFINKLERKPGFTPPPLTPPAVNIPHPWTRSVNGICFLETPAALLAKSGRRAFGPFEGHLIGCEYDSRRLIRMSLQKVGERWQGSCYPFSLYHPRDGKSLLGPLVASVSPNGDLYIGNIRDSGWGGANNIGSLVRLRLKPDELPAGIREVRAVDGGFEIDFTSAVDRELAANGKNYSVSSYRRISTPKYGGSDVDRRVEKVRSVDISPDGRRTTLRLGEIRTGFVYELRLKNLVAADREFFPAEAFCTVHATAVGS